MFDARATLSEPEAVPSPRASTEGNCCGLARINTWIVCYGQTLLGFAEYIFYFITVPLRNRSSKKYSSMVL